MTVRRALARPSIPFRCFAIESRLHFFFCDMVRADRAAIHRRLQGAPCSWWMQPTTILNFFLPKNSNFKFILKFNFNVERGVELDLRLLRLLLLQAMACIGTVVSKYRSSEFHVAAATILFCAQRIQHGSHATCINCSGIVVEDARLRHR